VRLAEEGADIVAVDLCKDVARRVVPASSAPEDLAETVRQVEALKRRVVAFEADVRDLNGLTEAVDLGAGELGRLDIVAADAGVTGVGQAWEMDDQTWSDTVSIDLSGVWHTARAAIPHIIDGGRGGSIVVTGSTAAEAACPFMSAYVAASHGVVGLAKSLALELGPYMIRVNTILQMSVHTPIVNTASWDEETVERIRRMNALPVSCVEPVDISNALAFLVSDEARYITGIELPVDAGFLAKTASPEQMDGMWMWTTRADTTIAQPHGGGS
jgi:(+)-trans-carveol dehydrogenase